MKCHVCGGNLIQITSQFPFRVAENSIVIIKDLPVLQCDHCVEYLIEDNVMEQVENIINKVDKGAELEILRFAA
jgi:YgiT-type zinc finger domain-containing protein